MFCVQFLVNCWIANEQGQACRTHDDQAAIIHRLVYRATRTMYGVYSTLNEIRHILWTLAHTITSSDAVRMLVDQAWECISLPSKHVWRYSRRRLIHYIAAQQSHLIVPLRPRPCRNRMPSGEMVLFHACMHSRSICTVSHHRTCTLHASVLPTTVLLPLHLPH